MPDTPTTDPLLKVLTALRDQVVGVRGTVVATADGLAVTADADGTHLESLAALSAATLSLGRRTAQEAGGRGVREVTTRWAMGYVVVLAIGDRALLTVLGDAGLDLATLQRVIPATIEQLASLFTADTLG
ncbi:roadblock/LC7 domain-containing protein [Streptomyces sp. NPDC029004]|uniref:roadblock/LC7 domain-containing protein n=1 Tax=Streptomyces sp. NPDC029004 TaxID=3154490 RepID=UPI0033E765A0